MAQPHSDIAVVILAGGEGQRMGGDKPGRMLGDRTLLERAIDRARHWSDTIAIAARSREQVGNCGLPVLIDPLHVAGPLAGLTSAAKFTCPLLLTIPCDMPFLPPDLLTRLASVLPGHGVSLAASDGKIHPVCGLWRTDELDRLPAYLATGRRSVVGFAESIGYASAEWSGEAFANINTPHELALAQARLT